MIDVQDLIGFMHAEQDAVALQAEQEGLLSAEALVASGKAIGNLYVRHVSDESVTFFCEENVAHFRPGDRLVLTHGDRRLRGTLMHVSDAGRVIELAVSSRVSGIHDIPWTAREETTDLSASYIQAARKLQPGAPGWSFFRIVTGAKSPKPSADSNAGQLEDMYQKLSMKSGRTLDDAQQNAWHACMNAGSVAAVQGPPGTGKTLVLAFVVEAMVQAGKRVVVLAPTHQAVNTALSTIHGLFSDRGVVKVGDAAKTEALDPSIPTIKREDKSAEPVEGRVTGMTYATAVFQLMLRASSIIPNVLVVDEAGQLPLAQGALAGLTGAGQVLLFGDDRQMPPVFSGDVKTHPLAVSLFAQLRRGQPAVMVSLRYTYRLNRELCTAVASTFYPDIPDGGLVSRQMPSRESEGTGEGYAPLTWVHVNAPSCRQINDGEASRAVQIVGAFLDAGLEPHEIAVVTPFRRQVARIRSMLSERGWYRNAVPIVDTVERVQGATVEVIVVSLCANDGAYVSRIAEFLFSPHRMNVAISRARNTAIVLSAATIFEVLPDTYKGILARDTCRDLLTGYAAIHS